MATKVLIAGRSSTDFLYNSETEVLTDLSGPSANAAHTADGETWYVAKWNFSTPGDLWKYDGSWTDLGQIATGWQYANDVFALSATRAIVAYSSASTGGVMEYNGGVETAHTPSKAALCFDAVPDSDRIFVLSSLKDLYYWDRVGTVWTLHSSIATTQSVRDMCVVAADDIWVVANKYSPYAGELWHYTGGLWSIVYTETTYALEGVSVVGSTIFLSTDANGVDAVILKSENGGSSFSVDGTMTGCSDLSPVRAVSATEAYVAGASGHFWVRSSGGWSQVSTGSAANLQRLYPYVEPPWVGPIKLPTAGLYIDEVRGRNLVS